jgi:hypothetical protein
MKQYEYKTVRVKKEAELLLLGMDGWQLTAVEKGKFYFKRTLPNPFSTVTAQSVSNPIYPPPTYLGEEYK